MARFSTYMTDDIYELTKVYPDVNWSKLFQEAVMTKVASIENTPTVEPVQETRMLFQRSNLRATLEWAQDSADYRLHFQVCDTKGGPLAEVATFDIGDPELQSKLRTMAQAFRMGQRFADTITPK